MAPPASSDVRTAKADGFFTRVANLKRRWRSGLLFKSIKQRLFKPRGKLTEQSNQGPLQIDPCADPKMPPEASLPSSRRLDMTVVPEIRITRVDGTTFPAISPSSWQHMNQTVIPETQTPDVDNSTIPAASISSLRHINQTTTSETKVVEVDDSTI